MIIKTWLNQNSPAKTHIKFIEINEHYWYKYVCRKEVIGPVGNIETR